MNPVRRIGVVLFEGSDLMDFAGPVSVFHCAARHFIWTGESNELVYKIQPLSIDGGPVTTLQGVVVETAAALELKRGEFDTIVLTGGMIDDRTCDRRLVDWIARNHDKARRVASVCCGAFILAAAGLLNGRRATTHWEDCGQLQRSYPRVEVRPDSIYVNDGKFWTAAGVTSGIDMALALVEQDYGRELALLVARRQVVFLKRPGGQSQFSAPLRCQTVEGPLSSLVSWIVENPCEDLRAETLAERANMSLRTFYRTFEAATGMPPAEWVEMTRIEIAKRFLEQTREHVDQVAFKAGFRSSETMRKVFAKRMGVTSSAYRVRFSFAQRPNAESARAALHSELLAGGDRYAPAGFTAAS